MESHTPNIKHPDLQRVIKLSHSKYFKGLVTISDILKQNFMKAGIPKDKILVLQDGVDIESFQNIEKTEARANLGLPQDKSIIMYCGHLYKGRGIEYILDAAKILKDVMFIIVGGFPSDVSYWKKYANDMFEKRHQVMKETGVLMDSLRNELEPILTEEQKKRLEEHRQRFEFRDGRKGRFGRPMRAPFDEPLPDFQ